MKKRSITIAGHATSVTLEDAFWDEIKRLAQQEGRSLSALTANIDAQKPPDTNLSSALRLYVLTKLKEEIK